MCWEGREEDGYDIIRFHCESYAAVAEKFGCVGIKVEKAEDIGPAIEKALACGKPAIIEVITDPYAIVPPAVE